MLRLLLLVVLFAALPAHPAGPARPTAAAEQHPGYGVVESVTPLRRRPAQESASAGASAPGKGEPASWLVRVRMDDGSVQVREVKRRAVRAGSRVLLTNAGEVLPD